MTEEKQEYMPPRIDEIPATSYSIVHGEGLIEPNPLGSQSIDALD